MIQPLVFRNGVPRRLLPLVLALLIARLWLAPLPTSFWVDEMGTAFVVQRGAADPSLQAVPQVPASVYYALPRLMQSLFGFLEVAYHLFLFGNNLSGSIPDSLGNLAELQTLALKLTKLSGAAPSQICKLPRLTELELPPGVTNPCPETSKK